MSRAEEVETVLRGESYIDFFHQMYGDSPRLWSEDLRGMDRLRVITNYLTRLRYCRSNGEMEFEHKTDNVPGGYSHWFSFPRTGNDIILFGHWAAIGGITHQPNMIALDTGCVWGRELTAYRLDDQQFFSVPAQNA